MNGQTYQTPLQEVKGSLLNSSVRNFRFEFLVTETVSETDFSRSSGSASLRETYSRG